MSDRRDRVSASAGREGVRRMESRSIRARDIRSRARRRGQTVETLIALASVAGLLAGALCSGTPDPNVEATRQVVVESGDSLWALALEHPMQGLSTAQTADLIAEVNHLPSSTLRPGDMLTVPVAPDASLAVAMR